MLNTHQSRYRFFRQHFLFRLEVGGAQELLHESRTWSRNRLQGNKVNVSRRVQTQYIQRYQVLLA